MTRSPFFYVGDKYKLIPQLRDKFPENINTLIEPFCGGGSVFLNIRASKYIANDLNFRMIELHNFLKSFSSERHSFFRRIEELIKYYGLSASALGVTVSKELKTKYVKTYYAEYNKESYSIMRRDYNKNKSDMFLLYLLLVYGFNHMLRFNKKGEFNLPVGNVDYNFNVINAINSYFDFMIDNEIIFYNYDYKKFLNTTSYSNDDLVYFDPPYLISNSEYNKNWSLIQEKELLNEIDKLSEKGVKVALSNILVHKGKKNELLREWSQKYNVYFIKSNYISYFDNSIKGDTVEILVTNF